MKILLVDDEFVSAQLLLNVMAPYGQCSLAGNGEEALAYFKDAFEKGEGFDLIIMDVMMPVMDGHTALKKIREFEVSKGIGGTDMVKAFMLTAANDYKSVMRSFKDGVVEAFLSKPLDMEELERQMARL